MIWKKIIWGSLLFIACDNEQVVKHISAEDKHISIEKSMLFGSSQQIVDFYAKMNFERIWLNSENRSDLISAIIDSQYDGVLLKDYPLQKLINAHWNYQLLSDTQLKKVDIAFTETYFKLAKQLAIGKVNPKKLYGDWEPYMQEKAYDSLLMKAINNNEVYNKLEDIKPKNKLYTQYKKAFAKYVPLVYSEAPLLENDLGKKIWINLERTKWLPPNLGVHYVWVNLPEYQLKVYTNNQLSATHKVIIGTKERRTPILSSTFSRIIINPTWTIPPTILKKDVVPKA